MTGSAPREISDAQRKQRAKHGRRFWRFSPVFAHKILNMLVSFESPIFGCPKETAAGNTDGNSVSSREAIKLAAAGLREHYARVRGGSPLPGARNIRPIRARARKRRSPALHPDPCRGAAYPTDTRARVLRRRIGASALTTPFALVARHAPNVACGGNTGNPRNRCRDPVTDAASAPKGTHIVSTPAGQRV